MLLAAVPIAALLPGCILFGLDDRELEINLPEIPVGPVQIQGSALRRDVRFCPATEAEIEALPETFERTLVQGVVTDLNQDPNVQQQGLDAYKDKIAGVTVRDITYKVDLNTLDKDLRSIDIWIGPPEAISDPANLDLEQAQAAGAVLFGSSDPIEAGTTTPGRVPIAQNIDSLDSVREYLSEFAFSAIFATTFEMTRDDCRWLGGDVEVQARIAITFFVESF